MYSTALLGIPFLGETKRARKYIAAVLTVTTVIFYQVVVAAIVIVNVVSPCITAPHLGSTFFKVYSNQYVVDIVL